MSAIAPFEASAPQDVAALFERAGLAAAKIGALKNPRLGATRATYEEIIAMADLIDFLTLARPDLIEPRSTKPPKQQNGGL